MTRYRFEISVHARRGDVLRGPATLPCNGLEFATLAVPHEALSEPLGSSFEEAVGALQKLPRMFCEPDGSFVWTSAGDGSPWQVDGQIHDRDGRLLLVDLKGSCPGEQFDDLLRAFGWPATAVMFQLVRQAVFLDEAELRRWATRGA